MYFEKEKQHYKYLYIYKHKYMNRYKNVLLEMIKKQKHKKPITIVHCLKKQKEKTKLYLNYTKNNSITKQKGY